MQTQTHPSARTRTNVLLDGFKLILGALLICLATAQAKAASVVVYANDFEAYSVAATSEADTADADPTGLGWAMVDDTAVSPTTAGAGIQVINWLSHSSSKSLLFRNGTYADVSFYNARSGSRYQLDFWMYVHKAPGNRGFRISLRGEGADHNGDDYLAYGSVQSTAANIRYYDGVNNTPVAGYWSNTVALHIEDTWQHHRLVIDPSALQMTVFIDDMVNPVITNVDLGRCEIAVPTLLRIQHEGDSADDGYCAIDDISFTVEDSRDLATTLTEGFESYPARASTGDDADPLGPWITVETDGTGAGRTLAPAKVQVVDTTTITFLPHSGSKCLKLEAGQRAGSSIAWGTTPQSDVQITWWARVPSAGAGVLNYLRMSLYGVEDGSSMKGDASLLGYGATDATHGDATSLTYYILGPAWMDTTVDYTPDTWEEYRLTTHTAAKTCTIIKNPSSANPTVVVDRLPMGGNTSPAPTSYGNMFMAAWSSSNGTNHPPVYIDDIEIKSLVSNPETLGAYSITNYGTRFTNWTVIQANAAVGRPVVDPRDNTTILVALDTPPPAGGIYRLQKVASGNWAIDPTPIIAGLDRPSGLAIQTNGTIWWTHDYTQSIQRLRAPWASNVVEEVISSFGDPAIDDDPIDLTVAPASFTGSIGQPGMIVVADRGVDGDANNGAYVIDPATTTLGQSGYSTFLVSPTPGDLGANLNAIASLPTSGEVVTVSEDGFLVAIDGSGTKRYINALTLWPFGGPASGAAIAVDPLTGKIWGADDLKDELWSIDATSAVEQREIGFPLVNASRPERQIDFHDPGMAFAPDGSFLVVSDASAVTGGRLIIFHNETISLPTFSISSVARGAQGVQLSWQSAGGAKYDVLRGTDLASAASFQSIATDLTGTSFTDTNAPAGAAFYRVVAKP